MLEQFSISIQTHIQILHSNILFILQTSKNHSNNNNSNVFIQIFSFQSVVIQMTPPNRQKYCDFNTNDAHDNFEN